MSDRPRPWPITVVILLLRLIWTAFVISVPLAGVWIASSLAALGNYPIWVACLAGAFAFPILPAAWELLAELLRRRAKARGPKRLSDLRTRGTGFMTGDARILTLWDRLVLRTLAVNLVFVGGLVWSTPETIYAALSARGDWMLEGVDAPWADAARDELHAAAERFEWLHERTHQNKYEALVEDEFTAPPPPPGDRGRDRGAGAGESDLPEPVAPPSSDPDPAPSDEQPREPDAGEPDPPGRGVYHSEHWPLAATVHPLIASMPAEAEVSIEAVARYVADNEADPFMRVKALHDYVATRIRYDTHAADVGPIPPQDAQTTFDTRLSVCAGYANLLAALVTQAGGEAVVIPGDARGIGGELGGEGHAWNAVEIGERWYFIDATWDAGASQNGKWGFGYSTNYLFVPPEVIGLTHYPDDPGWQLRARALTRGEFLRQPMLRPSFFAEGFDLISPQRSQVSVEDSIEIVLANEQGRYLMAQARDEAGGESACEVGRDDRAGRLTITCELPQAGKYDVWMFSNTEASGQFGFLGALGVNARG